MFQLATIFSFRMVLLLKEHVASAGQRVRMEKYIRPLRLVSDDSNRLAIGLHLYEYPEGNLKVETSSVT
jgi:hypothetical protein